MKSIRLIHVLLSSTVAFAAWGHEPETPEPPLPEVKETAGGLLTTCAASSLTPRGRMRLRYCYGYLTGVEETMRVVMAGDDAICPPTTITTRELAQVYVRYASSRPDDHRLPAVTVVARALRDRYSCSR